MFRIPTKDQTAKLLRGTSVPFSKKSTGGYSQVQEVGDLIAINSENSYLELTKEDLIDCKFNSDMYLCPNLGKIYKRRTDASCLSSIYFEDMAQIVEFCAFKTEEIIDLPMPTKLAQGIYHFSVQQEEKFVLNCESEKMNITEVFGNGIIYIPPNCKGSLGIFLF